MLKKATVINEASLTFVNLTGNTEHNIIIMINTALTKISGAQPVLILFDAVRQSGHTYLRKYAKTPDNIIACISEVSDQCKSLNVPFIIVK